MSDNLSTMKQAAVAGADDSAVDMADPVTERNGTADNRDQPEDGNDAGSLTADDSESGKLVNGAKANASAAKQAKGTKASKASSTKVSPTKSSPTKTSPKKRANGVNDDEDGSPKKKRAPAKAKAAATAEQSTEEVAPKRKAAVKEEALTPEPADSAGVSDEVQVPVTPMKGKRKSAADQTTEFKTPRTPKTPKASTAAKEEKDTTPTPTTTPRKRLAADKVADKVSLPTSWGAASDADKELVAMKKSGSSWNDIRAMWMEKTGQNTATSTLPNRYKRLTLVMMQLQEEEKALLATAKAEVEDNWKTKKWSLIATELEKKGGGKYPAEFLQKEWKKIEAARVAAQAAAAGGEALLAAAVAAVGNDENDDDDEEAEEEGLETEE